MLLKQISINIQQSVLLIQQKVGVIFFVNVVLMDGFEVLMNGFVVLTDGFEVLRIGFEVLRIGFEVLMNGFGVLRIGFVVLMNGFVVLTDGFEVLTIRKGRNKRDICLISTYFPLWALHSVFILRGQTIGKTAAAIIVNIKPTIPIKDCMGAMVFRASCSVKLLALHIIQKPASFIQGINFAPLPMARQR